jgi:hypothetical protein
MELKFDLNIPAIQDFLIKIENLDLIKEDIKKYHPDDPRYIQYWRDVKKKCIEGFWIPQFGKWRFVPGRLYFYANFCTILDVNEVENTRIKIKPDIRDIEWIRSYMVQYGEGFSGWSDDNKYTSDVLVLPDRKEIREIIKNSNPQRYNTLLNEYGNLKEFKEPWINLTELKDKPLGVQLYWNDALNSIELGARGGGKQLSINELVRVKEGWKEIQNLQVGEQVYGSNGKLSKITNKSAVEEYPYYKITLRDGREIEACENHSWKVWDKNKNRNSEAKNYSVLTTKEMYENYYWERVDSPSRKKGIEKKTKEFRYALPLNKAISEDNNSSLPIDPYFLGLLLGDGGMTSHIQLTSGDYEIIEYAEKIAVQNNWTYRIVPYRDELKHDILFTNKNLEEFSLKDVLKQLGLHGKTSEYKFIPEQYLYSSIENRLALLQGLMDTDGFADRTHIEFYTISEQLSKDFQNLIRSLGYNCKVKLKDTSYRDKEGKKVNCKPCYRISIYGHDKFFKLERKQKFVDANMSKSLVGKSKWDKSFIVDIQPIGDKRGLCIEVDNEDHTYITKDYIVTHNSYFYSLGVAKHEICFNGLKYYTEDSMETPPKAEVCIGSGATSKSAEFAKKIEDSMNELAANTKFGAWGKLGDDDYVPSPLYKEMAGSLKPNNKENLWRHEYQINSNGTWMKKGSGSYIAHVVYSTQKKDGAEAAAGGRYGKALIEEIGLTELAEEVFNSNKATVQVEGKQFGSQIGLGTSGNMETIIPAKKWFLNPEIFDTVSFDDIYEHSGKIGFFLPAFLTARQFKDKDGNTNVKAAVDFYLRRRQKYIENKDAKGLEGEMMNYPIKPSEMFLSSVGSRLPVPELMDHYRDLIMNRKFHEYATVGELIFDPKERSGVKFQPDLKNRLQPITEYPIPRGQSQEGALVIYEHPIEDRNGEVPPFLYLIGHDPTAKDHTTSEGSLASIFVIKTALDPLKYGYYELVAEYIGRPYEGRDKVNEILEKLAEYYGGTPGMIYFENQVGNTKEYFQKRGKLSLLASQPQRVFNPKGGWTKQISYGYPMSNKNIKDNAIDYLADWLKENRILGDETEDGKKRCNYHYLKSPRLISEMISYNDNGNFDGVMGFLGCVIGIRERFNQFNQKKKEEETQRGNNILQQFIEDDFILSRRYNKTKQYGN